MSDQHHAGFMGCAGNPYARTPNMDRLAEGGVRFSDMYTSCPLCVPARMGFMTGKLPSKIQNWTNGCVALTNEQLDDLTTRVHIGTRVDIR